MRSLDVDGRLHVADCRISKANVCPYYGKEIPGSEALGLDPNRIYNLYRDPAELERAAPTFANLQLLMAHVPVNADDPRIDVTVGVVGSDVRFEAPFLVASLAVWTAEGIALIESKAQAQLSCSYRYRPDMTPGVTLAGVAFDGVMRDIVGNHVALVEEGRAGPDVIVNDATPLEARTMKHPNVVKLLQKIGVLPATADVLALDAELEKIGAKDAEPEDKADDEDMEDDPENPGQKRKKVAKDASEPAEPGPKKGETGAALDAAIKAKKLVTAEDAATMVAAAKLDAETNAVTRINALHAARKEVEPLVGIVAFDSAEAVYKFALDKVGVKTEGVHASAFPQLVAMAKARAASAPPARMAADAVSSADAALAGLSRIVQA